MHFRKIRLVSDLFRTFIHLISSCECAIFSFSIASSFFLYLFSCEGCVACVLSTDFYVVFVESTHVIWLAIADVHYDPNKNATWPYPLSITCLLLKSAAICHVKGNHLWYVCQSSRAALSIQTPESQTQSYLSRVVLLICVIFTCAHQLV